MPLFAAAVSGLEAGLQAEKARRTHLLISGLHDKIRPVLMQACWCRLQSKQWDTEDPLLQLKRWNEHQSCSIAQPAQEPVPEGYTE